MEVSLAGKPRNEQEHGGGAAPPQGNRGASEWGGAQWGFAMSWGFRAGPGAVSSTPSGSACSPWTAVAGT